MLTKKSFNKFKNFFMALIFLKLWCFLLLFSLCKFHFTKIAFQVNQNLQSRTVRKTEEEEKFYDLGDL